MRFRKLLNVVRDSLRRDHFTSVVLLCAAAYVALAWTPSSYSVLFDQLGAPREGLVMGEPRPIREDEWARWTPFIQTAVNNDFQRVNHTSVYEEDLRNVEGLPLRDWAIGFKPSFWPFYLTAPARAFSFHHAFWMALFLIGYHHLFRAFGVAGAASGLASVALFASSFSMTWWTTYGPIMAGFPWVLLAFLQPSRGWIRGLLALYAMSVWLFGNLYPPIMITLAFVAFTALLALRPQSLAPKRALPALVGMALGCALMVLYLGDVFTVMADTHYPGHRISGGGGPPPVQWLAHVFPFAMSSGYSHLVTWNICEASTISSYLPLLAMCFIDHRGWAQRLVSSGEEGRRVRRQLTILSIGALLTSLWILLPLPAAVGMPLLWHLVPAKRMWFACGLLIFLLALMILRGAPLRVTWPRLTAFSTCVFLSWIGSEMWLNATPQWGNHEDLWILLPLFAVVLFRRRLAASLRPALIGCAALANLLAFGLFNPIQSALPIFAPPKAVADAKLVFDRVAQRHPRGWLVLPESWGASLNGLGYKSVAHILLAPETEWFRPWFPELAEETLNEVFNRTTYPVLTLQSHPSTYDETDLRLPVDVFDPPTVDVDVMSLPVDGGEVRGQVERRDLFEANGSLTVALVGWGNFDGSDSSTRLTVYTNLPVERAVAYPAMRPGTAESPNEPGLVVSGLALRLELRRPAGAGAALRRLIEITPICVVSEDPVRGRFLLHPARFPPAACTAGG